MKRIVFLTAHAGTLINFRKPLIKLLSDRGFDVIGLAPNFDDSSRLELRNIGATPMDCPISRTGMNPLVDFFNTLRMAILLKKIKPDIVFSYMIKPVIFGSIAAKLAGVPRRFAMIEGLGYVFTEDGNEFSIKRKCLKKIVIFLYKLGILSAEKVFFLNPDDQAEMIGLGVLPLEKSFLLGGIGVDLKFWSSETVVTNPITFTLVARLLKEKGVYDYVAAAKIVKKKYPFVRFILLGGLDENPGSISKDELNSWVNSGVVEWPGHTAVHPWMEKTSVFVLPSYYREGVPASTQEAMAMGRAIITTNVPGCRETVVHGVNGFLVPPRAPEALANAIISFVENKNLIQQMGARSREMAEIKFDAHKVNLNLINELGLSGQ